MLREMRRTLQALPQEEVQRILESATAGVLALSGDEGYPYAVPISYVYADGKLYFHCAKEGHKLDAIRRCEKASFCIVDQDEIQPEKATTYYRSVIAFGRMREVTDADEMRAILGTLMFKYGPMLSEKQRAANVEKDLAPVCVLAMDIDFVSGKEGRDLAAQRRRDREV